MTLAKKGDDMKPQMKPDLKVTRSTIHATLFALATLLVSLNSHAAKGVLCSATAYSYKDGIGSATATTKLLVKDGESQRVRVELRDGQGSSVPFQMDVAKVSVPTNGPRRELEPGLVLALNNPFDSGAVLKRNDLTGETVVSAQSFYDEMGRPISSGRFGGPARSSVGASYLEFFMKDPQHGPGQGKKLIMPGGASVDTIMIFCQALVEENGLR